MASNPTSHVSGQPENAGDQADPSPRVQCIGAAGGARRHVRDRRSDASIDKADHYEASARVRERGWAMRRRGAEYGGATNEDAVTVWPRESIREFYGADAINRGERER
jgi:hypothetical protein